MKKTIRLILNFFCYLLIALVAIFSIWNVVDKNTGYNASQFGYRYSVIISNSMSEIDESNDYITDKMNQYSKYDVIITKEYKTFDEIQIYDAVSYYSTQGLICHRVVKKYTREDGEQFIIARGDANNADDAPVNYKNVKGKVIGSIPGFGQFLLFFQSPYFILCICGIGFFVTLGIYFYKKDDDIDYTFGIIRRPVKISKNESK